MSNISQKTIDSPEFMVMSAIANDMLQEAVRRSGASARSLDSFDTHAGRVVDDLTMLLIRISKAND